MLIRYVLRDLLLNLHREQSHAPADGVVEHGEVAPGHPVMAGQGDGFLPPFRRPGTGLCRPGPLAIEGGAFVDSEGVGGGGAEGGRYTPVQVVVAPQHRPSQPGRAATKRSTRERSLTKS